MDSPVIPLYVNDPTNTNRTTGANPDPSPGRNTAYSRSKKNKSRLEREEQIVKALSVFTLLSPLLFVFPPLSQYGTLYNVPSLVLPVAMDFASGLSHWFQATMILHPVIDPLIDIFGIMFAVAFYMGVALLIMLITILYFWGSVYGLLTVFFTAVSLIK